MSDSLKIVYFGYSGMLSSLPFRALLESEHVIQAVVINDAMSAQKQINILALDQPDNIASIAFENNVRIIRLKAEFSGIQSQLHQLNPDVIVTSCFRRKIPHNICSIARIASLNIHPSLLPAYRGPAPIFWQIRDAVKISGVSIHIMADDFDAGNIVAQEKIKIQEQANYQDIVEQLAEMSASLLIKTLQDCPEKIKQAKPQGAQGLSYHSNPQLSDFEISLSWEAKRVYEFMRATESIAAYYPLFIGGEELKLLRVIAYNSEQTHKLLIQGNKVTFPCKNGYVEAEILTV